jgi:AbrB family looped-hinge helix DNA binding protein
MAEYAISTKGWVVIPKIYRDKYGLQPGVRVRFVDYGGSLAIVPVKDDPVEMLHGMLADGPSLTEALLEERARDRHHEDRGWDADLRS